MAIISLGVRRIYSTLAFLVRGTARGEFVFLSLSLSLSLNPLFLPEQKQSKK